MKKKSRIAAICMIIFLSMSVYGSWYGETTLLVRIDKVYPSGPKTKKVGISVLKWAKGGGHSPGYGKFLVGYSLTVDFLLKRSININQLKVGQKAWVKKEHATWFSLKGPGENEKWIYLGKSWEKSNLIKKLGKNENVPDSPEIKLLWSLFQDNIVTLKIKYHTQNKWYPKFQLNYKKSARKEVKMYLTYKMTYSGSKNSRDYSQELLQFNLKEFSGKKVVIYSRGKKLDFDK